MKKGKGTKVWHEEKSVLLNCEIGDDTTIHAPVWIGDNVIIGSRCKVQAFCFIPEGVVIGDDVFIAPSVTFTNDKNPPSGKANWLTTIVKNGASIGAGCVILPGITIGRNAKIGAGSVVTKSIPDGETWFGNPAKPYK